MRGLRISAISAFSGARASSERMIGGLAGADFAGQLDEAAGLADAIDQVRERFGMLAAEVEIARIGVIRRLFGRP